MATLNENVATVKENFRNIRDTINQESMFIAEDERPPLLTDEPVEEYASQMETVIGYIKPTAYNQGQSEGYDTGHSDGVEIGKDIGKDEILSNSKYIPKQATGKLISLTDVSEVAHKVKVYGDNQEVKACGKNLFDISASTEFTKQTDGSYAINVSKSGKKTPLVLPYGTYTLSYELKCPVGKNARIRIDFKDGTYIEQYQVSTGEFLYFEKVVTGEIVSWHIECSSHSDIGTLVVKDAILNVGSIGESYEPYTHQTITAIPTGTEIDSICPNMNFIADNDITVDYYSSFGMVENQKRLADSCQINGTRTNYTYAFAYTSWSDYTFEQMVNYDIAPFTGNNMFAHSRVRDLAGIMNRKGIKFDFITNAPTQVFSLFYNSSVEHVPEIIMPTTSTAYGWFGYCAKLHTIDGLCCNEKTKFEDSSGGNQTFQNCSAFTHCIFSGLIENDISLKDCPLLDNESVVSLAKTLRMYQSVDEGFMTRTITLHPDVWVRAQEINVYDSDEIFVSVVEYIDACGWNRA